jgi:RHS repeat-associated protein
MVSTTDPLGHATRFAYSSAYHFAYLTQQSIIVSGKNVSQRYAYNFNTGWQTSSTDAKGGTTSYAYDSLGRVTQVTNPAVGQLITKKFYAYDDKHNAVNITDEDGNLVRNVYDGLGRLTETKYYNGTSLFTYQLFYYNWQNQLAYETKLGGGAGYSYFYDYFGRLTQVTNPDGTFHTITYNLLNNTVVTVDENGNRTEYLMDKDGRLTGVEQYYSLHAFYYTKYTYDNAGNLLSVLDADGHLTVNTYNDVNQLVSTTYPDKTVQSMTYDKDGNVATMTDAGGNVTRYSYDALNRLTSVMFPNSTSLSYVYDPNGNMVKMVYPAQAHKGPNDTTTFAYDSRNRLTGETETVGGVAYKMNYTYDGVGNVVSMRYPDGYTVAMKYNALNRLHVLGTLAIIYYNADGVVSSIKYGDGQVASYSYNLEDEVTRILVMQGAVKQLDLNYTYDKVGNVKTIDSETYSYDALDRLVSSKGPWGVITYGYDAVGNRLSMIQGQVQTTYTYNNVDELKKAGTTSYSYDLDGNLKQEVAGSTTWDYRYDYQNQLISVTEVTGSSKTVVQKNVYDCVGNRIEQIASSTTTVYVYNQGGDIAYYKTGSSVTKIFYADGMTIARITGSTTYYYHGDELGSTRLESTSSGGTYFSSDYKPYGPQYQSSGTETFMYTGTPYDTATGLYYMGARYYDPTTGRFITRDSVGGYLQDPQSLNAYAYARDNPLTNIDPTGLFSHRHVLTATEAALVVSTIILAVGVPFTLGADLPIEAADVVTLAGTLAAGAAASTTESIPEIVGGSEEEGVSSVGQTLALLWDTDSSEEYGSIMSSLRNLDESFTNTVELGDRAEVRGQNYLVSLGKITDGTRLPSITGKLVQIDLFDDLEKWIYESKGYFTSWTEDTENQIIRLEGVIANGQAAGMSFIFSDSPITGEGGPSLSFQWLLWSKNIPWSYIG